MGSFQGRHLSCYRHGIDADSHNFREEVDHAFFVIREAVRVELGSDRRVAGFLFLVLIEDPVDSRTVAKAVIPGMSRDTGDLSIFINDNRAGIGIALQLRLRLGALGALDARSIYALDGPWRDVVIPDVHGHQSFAPRGPFREISVDRDAGEFALEVLLDGHRAQLRDSRPIRRHQAGAL